MKTLASLAATLSILGTAISADAPPTASAPLVFKKTVQADCPRLKKVGIEIPALITVTDLKEVTCDFDLTWISKNFPEIMRAALPAEGGKGGDRYSYSGFQIAAQPDGTARATVHMKLENYKYTTRPVRIEVKAGTVQADVVATIKPEYRAGIPDTSTSVEVLNAKASGLIKLFNQAVPKKWFSLDREVRNATRDANKQVGEPLLVFRPEPDFEKLIADAIERKLIEPAELNFYNSATGLGLTGRYRIVGGASAFYELFSVYLKYNKPEPK
jgi:hypothetical protein